MHSLTISYSIRCFLLLCLQSMVTFSQLIQSKLTKKLELLEQSKTDILLKPLAIIPILVSIAVMGVAQNSGDYSGVE